MKAKYKKNIVPSDNEMPLLQSKKKYKVIRLLNNNSR